MNKYKAIHSAIFDLIKKEANFVYAKYNIELDKEDIKQELTLKMLQALDNFDIKTGSILSYTKHVLRKKSIDLVRFHLQDKRKYNLNCVEINENIMLKKENVKMMY